MNAGTEKSSVIVVGVDGRDSDDALLWAATQATLAGASLEAITAWTWPTAWGREPTWPPGFDPEEQTRAQLAEAVDRVLGSDRSLEVRQVVLEGHPAPVLVAAAAHAGLLVVGSHGHGAFAGMFLGSVSMHCVAQASCPVVVVPRRSSDGV